MDMESQVGFYIFPATRLREIMQAAKPLEMPVEEKFLWVFTRTKIKRISRVREFLMANTDYKEVAKYSGDVFSFIEPTLEQNAGTDITSDSFQDESDAVMDCDNCWTFEVYDHNAAVNKLRQISNAAITKADMDANSGAQALLDYQSGLSDLKRWLAMVKPGLIGILAIFPI